MEDPELPQTAAPAFIPQPRFEPRRVRRDEKGAPVILQKPFGEAVAVSIDQITENIIPNNFTAYASASVPPS